MHESLQRLLATLIHLGPAGLFALGVLDSSFLFMPLGNDLLIIALTLNNRTYLPLYVAMASAGSCTGVFLLDLIARKGGEVGLKKIMRRRRFEFLKRKMEKRAGLPVALAGIAPPPFPFTAVIATASAFNYPRVRLLGIVLGSRVVRFTAVGLLAIAFGHQILEFAKTNAFLGVMVAIIAGSFVGSLISIVRWVRQSRRA